MIRKIATMMRRRPEKPHSSFSKPPHAAAAHAATADAAAETYSSSFERARHLLYLKAIP